MERLIGEPGDRTVASVLNNAARSGSGKDRSKLSGREVTIDLTRGQLCALEELEKTGLFGDGFEDIISRFLDVGLQEQREQGWFYL